MSLVVACGNQRFTVTGDEILIGRDTACAISFPEDARLAARHAALRIVGGRWLIEARAGSMLQVGNAAPSRLGWLNDGDVIRLTPNGPELIVNPPVMADVSRVRANGMTDTDLSKSESPPPKISSSTETALACAGRSTSKDWKTLAVISAAIVIVLGVLWELVPKSDPASKETAVKEPATPPQIRDIEPIADEPAVAVANNPGKPVGAADSVYAVLVASEDRQQVYQIGTAWAVSPQRLVTSGAVTLAVERLRQNLGVVMVRHPTTKTDFFVAERTHPKFVALTSLTTQLQTQLVELDRQLEKATDPAEKQSLEQQLQKLDMQLVAQLRETMYFDIGILEVRDRLPHVLPPADTSPVKGQRVRMLGVPFPDDEPLLNPDRPPQHHEVSGQLLASLPEIGSAASPIVFNAPLKDFQGQQWSGTPVLNSAGQVVAVFSRLAPPDIKGPPDLKQLRPHATDIRILRELFP